MSFAWPALVSACDTPWSNLVVAQAVVELAARGDVEFEEDLAELARHNGIKSPAKAGIPKIKFRMPDRSKLPSLDQYAFLTLSNGDRRTAIRHPVDTGRRERYSWRNSGAG